LEVDVQQGNFKILRLLPQVLILFLVEKWIPPRRSKLQKLVKKTEGILGVKAAMYTEYTKSHLSLTTLTPLAILVHQTIPNFSHKNPT
jgi:hypothetical protein